jgi:hypothetical protein
MADFIDEADWKGVVIRSVKVCSATKRNASLTLDGQQYATEGELLAARMLTAAGIPFTPNVQFELLASEKSKRKQMLYVADFIFNREAYIWTNPDGTQELVHGIEAKGLWPAKKEKCGKKVRALKRQRNINVKLLSTMELRELEKNGGLPLIPFED